MNNIRIIKTAIVFLITVSFSINIYAVYEGRDESLEQYQSIRSEADLTSANRFKAYSSGGFDDFDNPEGNGPPMRAPISDPLSFFLFCGGVFCGLYALRSKNKEESDDKV